MWEIEKTFRILFGSNIIINPSGGNACSRFGNVQFPTKPGF